MKAMLLGLLENKKLVAHALGWALGAVLVASAGALGIAPDAVKEKLCGVPAAAEPAK